MKFSLALLAAPLLGLSQWPAPARDAGADIVLRPLAEAQFQAGAKSVAGYFVADGRLCRLKLTIAGAPALELALAIGAGKSSRLVAADPASPQFACAADARTLVVSGARTAPD